MSAPLVIPFNYDGGTTTLKTTSYTVGAGKYCYAIPYDVRCTVNSVEMFISATAHCTFTMSGTRWLFDDRFSGKVTATGNTDIGKISGTTFYSGTGTGVGSVYFNNGMITNTAPGNLVVLGVGWYANFVSAATITIFNAHLHGSWYKAGDVLTGGNWRVTEYNGVT